MNAYEINGNHNGWVPFRGDSSITNHRSMLVLTGLAHFVCGPTEAYPKKSWSIWSGVLKSEFKKKKTWIPGPCWHQVVKARGWRPCHTWWPTSQPGKPMICWCLGKEMDSFLGEVDDKSWMFETWIEIYKFHQIPMMLYYVILCYTMLYYVILCYTMLYYVILCYTMLYYVILCYTMLYYVVLCCTIIK